MSIWYQSVLLWALQGLFQEQLMNLPPVSMCLVAAGGAEEEIACPLVVQWWSGSSWNLQLCFLWAEAAEAGRSSSLG